MNMKKFFSTGRNRALAALMAAVLIVGGVALGLSGTLAANEITINYSQPNKNTLLAIGGGEVQGAGGIYRADVNDDSRGVIRVDKKTAVAWIKAANNAKPGMVTAVYSTRNGIPGSQDFQVYDPNGLASVTLINNGQMTIKKNANVNAGSAISATGPTAFPKSNIKWEAVPSGNPNFTVAPDGTINATENGIYQVIGKVTDKWGVERIIPVTVTVGPKVDVITGLDGKEYVAVTPKDGNKDVFAEVDDNGNVKVPTGYWEDITTKNPPTQVWPDGNGGWTKTQPPAPGVVEYPVGSGNYFVKVPNTDNNGGAVWVQTDKDGNIKQPEVYVGGSGSSPDTSKPLYKIQVPNDVLTVPPATDYDDTFPGWLTKYPNGGTSSEYDRWQSALKNTAAPSLTISSASVTLTEGYAATTSGVFTVNGSPAPTVSKTSGDGKISWNNATKKLDIAAGLTQGVYKVELTATNANGSSTTVFTVTVQGAPKTDLQQKINTAKEGDTVNADGKEWYVVKKTIVNGENVAMLVAKNSFGDSAFGSSSVSSYEGSTLQSNITDYYKNTSDIKQIAVVPNLGTLSSKAAETTATSTLAGNQTKDIFFALSWKDVDNLKVSMRQSIIPNGYWWTRTPDGTTGYFYEVNNKFDYVSGGAPVVMIGVIPGVWVKY